MVSASHFMEGYFVLAISAALIGMLIYFLVQGLTLTIKLIFPDQKKFSHSQLQALTDFQQLQNFKDPKAHLPKILEDATVLMNEKEIRTEQPFPVFGKVDQVFRLKDSSLVILDTKYRQHQNVFASDVAQLSVYALILAQRGYKVRDFGYIRLVNAHMIEEYRAVKLIHPKTLAALWNRYHDIRLNNAAVSCTCGKHNLAQRTHFSAS